MNRNAALHAHADLIRRKKEEIEQKLASNASNSSSSVNPAKKDMNSKGRITSMSRSKALLRSG